MSLEVKLFGQAGIFADGQPVKLAKRATSLSLIAYLILQRGAPVARASLAYVIFPDESEESALGELRRYLYLTGKALPAASKPWIEVEGDTVRWNVEAPCAVDVLDFERAVADPERLDEAVALYGGDLLAEIYDDWVMADRERLRSLCLETLATLARTRRAERDFGRALAALQRLLALDPWREDIVRMRMAVRYESGDAAGALAEYSRFARRLGEEMGVAPMPETVALREAIVRNDRVPGALPAPPPHEPSAWAVRRPLLPFVGRERERALLVERWHRAARGHGTTIAIGGEAGRGKTRLTSELARVVEEQGGRVFAGGTSLPESMPYQAVIEALRSALPLVAARPTSPVRAAVLARALPELRADLDEPVETGALSPESEAARLVDVLADAAIGLSAARPALLVFEDLHWAGNATLAAVAALARRAHRAALLVVLTYRDEEVGPAHPLRALLRDLRAEQRLERLELGPLDRADVAELVARLDDLPHDATFVDRLFAQTEGNALFLNETIADAREERGDVRAAGAVLPAGVEGVILARIGRLGQNARAIAEVASVVGNGCDLDVACAVSGLAPAAVSAAFNELLDRRLVRESSVRSGVDFVFTHHLIAATVYRNVDAKTRKHRHARVAHVLERSHGADARRIARELAGHYEAAELASEAARWYGEAARASAALFANDDAIAFATRALELGSDAAERRSLLALREGLRGLRGDRAGQREDIDLLEASLAEADVGGRFDVVRRRVLLARSLGESEAEQAQIEHMTAIAARSGDDRLRAEALRQYATHAVMLSRQSEAVAPATEALALFERSGDVPAQIECLSLLVDAAANGGELDASRAYLRAMSERASSLTDRAVHARALTTAAVAALLAQRYAEARDLSREALQVATATGDRNAQAAAHVRIAATSARLDDFERAFDEAALAEALYTEIDNKRGLATLLTNQTALMMRLGLFEEALAAIERSNALLPVVRERRMNVANAVNASFVHLRLGAPDAARRCASEGLIVAREIGFPVFEAAALANLGNAERALGNVGAALEAMERGLAIRRSVQALPDFADDLSDLIHALVAAGRVGEALSGARELASLDEAALRSAFWPPYCLWSASVGFAAGGELSTAAEFSERARAALERFAQLVPAGAMREAFLAIDVNRTIAGSAHAGRTPLR